MYGRMICLAVLLTAVVFVSVPSGADDVLKPAWDRETLKMFSALPVQDGGRIKPLDTYASFTLLQLNGRKSCPDVSGERLAPVAWLLDCFFYPEQAGKYPVFRVENSEAIIALGLQPKRKRDNYSYADLLPAQEKLMDMGARLSDKQARLRTTVENEIISLAMNFRKFEEVISFTDFARKRISIAGSMRLSALFPKQEQCRVSDILMKAPDILSTYRELQKNREEEKEEYQAFNAVLQDLEGAVQGASALALFPPPVASEERQWMTPADLVAVGFSGAPVMLNQVGLLASFETLVNSTGDPAAFKEAALAFSRASKQVAADRGEYAKIPLEVFYYRLNLFYYALVLYVLSFIMVAALWMRPHHRLLNIGAFIAVSVPTCLLLLGITLRCIIRERPPVTSVYETILFVTAVVALVALFMEWANRQGLAISLGALLGAAGMFFANKYEAGLGSDTMPAMAAVLNTNFWLAAHVTTIAIGYGAGFLASGLAHVFIFGRLSRFRRDNTVFYRDLTRMVYGSLCFSFVFVCIGTVLGGIWANESWGRFWGWDPKENGALMICLWQLAVLHAKKDGLLRGYGINIAAIIGGIIIAFCWFGVNMLNVGLHSYGFSSGGYAALQKFYLVETVIVFLGCFIWLRERKIESINEQ